MSANESADKFFQNTACPHFPCHANIQQDDFNCMFCYCPLYPLGTECGGDYRFTSRGVKDCSACTRNHQGLVGAQWVLSRIPDVLNATRLQQGAQQVRE